MAQITAYARAYRDQQYRPLILLIRVSLVDFGWRLERGELLDELDRRTEIASMTDPGQMAAISLTLATSPITQLVETIDGPVYLKVMSRTSDEVGETFWAVQRDAAQADGSLD